MGMIAVCIYRQGIKKAPFDNYVADWFPTTKMFWRCKGKWLFWNVQVFGKKVVSLWKIIWVMEKYSTKYWNDFQDERIEKLENKVGWLGTFLI